jgi:glycosyltransferase involved in cell wall biosynthesis
MTRADEAHPGQQNRIEIEPGAVQERARRPGLFRSFWIAGFEGADHRNGRGIALAPGQATQHLERLEEDYRAIAALGVRTVRESIGWRTTETRPRTYDFSSLERMARAAQSAGLQVIWTLMHYGWPADLDIFSPRFAERFAHFADAAARCLRRLSPDTPFFAPVNEISFLSWAVSSTGLVHPYDGSLQEHGFRVKRQLVRAAVRGSEAIWNVDPRARLVHADPLIHIVAPPDRPDLALKAQRQREYQFQAWDMLAGTLEPELGGSRRLLDIVGAHYYHGNQWEQGGEVLHWHLRDPRRAPLSQLLGELHARYRRPLALLETGHVGAGRAQWIEEIADEVVAAERRGVPVEGVCLYPAIDRPDWTDLDQWHHSGLWDLVREADGSLRRELNADYAKALRRCQRRLPDAWPPADAAQGRRVPTIVVFSHLRWDFVFQRPQHLMSRFARDHRIVFVEEPVHHPELAFLERWTPCANLEVLRPHTPVHADGFHDEQLPVLAQLLDEFLHSHGIVPDAAWLYTPMALPLATRIAPRRIVYDCMDELAAFKSAPRQLVQRENALLRVADVVFTGGPSLHRAKCDRHPAVHCFPSSVDEAHFAQAKRVPSHPAQAAIGSPRLGFFGVIDERMDFRLIEALADARRDWQVVMVGPVAKIEHEMLPQRPNLHWLGQHGYDELPRFLAGWDVCLLPFALNDATRYISPTKTPEYLAAGKPVVSTALADVNELYGHLVRIAHDITGFIEHCQAALEEPDSARAYRQAQSAELFVRTSWERTVQSMRALVFASRGGERRQVQARSDPMPGPSDVAADQRAGTAQARSA